MSQNNITIALDLEGTIISDETARIPRPKLYPFLESCRELGRVVIYTMVDPDTAREIVQELADNGIAPGWFADVEWVDWFSVDTDFKDLDLIPGSDAKHAFLVDDNIGFVRPDQMDRWVRIPFFDPRNRFDKELDIALWNLRRKVSKQTGVALDLDYPGYKNKALIDMQDEIEDLIQDISRLQAENQRLTQIIIESE